MATVPVQLQRSVVYAGQLQRGIKVIFLKFLKYFDLHGSRVARQTGKGHRLYIFQCILYLPLPTHPENLKQLKIIYQNVTIISEILIMLKKREAEREEHHINGCMKMHMISSDYLDNWKAKTVFNRNTLEGITNVDVVDDEVDYEELDGLITDEEEIHRKA